MSWRRLGAALIAVFLTGSAYGDLDSSRMNRRTGWVLGFVGEPLPALWSLNLQYHFTDYLRGSIGYGCIETSNDAETTDLDLSTLGVSFQTFVPGWSLSPTIGLGWSLIWAEVVGGANGLSISGITASNDTTLNHFYLTLGLDWQSSTGFHLGAGYNHSLRYSGVEATLRSDGFLSGSKNIDFLFERPIAHRGLHGEKCPENSLGAFEQAIAKGYSIELDVQLSQDGKLVVYHDAELDRLTACSGPLSRYPAAALREIRLNGSEEKIPLFQEALDVIAGQVPILIDVKTPRADGEIERRLMHELKNYKGQFAVQSFHPYTPYWFKKHAPEVPRGFISCRFSGMDHVKRYQKFLLKNLVPVPLVKPDFLTIRWDMLETVPVRLARNSGVPILSWTVENEEHLEQSKEKSENFIFENIRPSIRARK